MSKRFNDSAFTPPSHAVAVTPHDSDEILENGVFPRGLYVGGAGDLVVRFADSSANVTLTAVPAGTVLDMQVKLVAATGTTATNIVALF